MLERKTNPHLVDTILSLKRASREHDAPIWRAVAKQLEKPTRVWPVVNVGDLQRVADTEKTQIVAGKVLGSGWLDKGVTVIAWSFSASAREKIEAEGGRCLRLDQAIDEFATGTDLQVVA